MRNVASRALASPAKIDAPLTNRRRGKARASAIMFSSTPVCCHGPDVHKDGLAMQFVAVLDYERDTSEDQNSHQESDQRVQYKNRPHGALRHKSRSDLLHVLRFRTDCYRCGLVFMTGILDGLRRQRIVLFGAVNVAAQRDETRNKLRNVFIDALQSRRRCLHGGALRSDANG